MGTFPRRSFVWCLVSMLIAVAELGSAIGIAAAQRQKQVLVLYSTRRDAQIVAVAERELPRVLEAGLPEGVDYYSEYIDRARFPDPAYQEGFRQFLRIKYQGQQFDVIIAILAIPLIRAEISKALSR